MSIAVFVLLNEQYDAHTKSHFSILLGVYRSAEAAQAAAVKDAEVPTLKWRSFWFDNCLSLDERTSDGEMYCIHRETLDDE